MRRCPRILGLLAALVVASAPSTPPATAQGLIRLDVTLGKSQIIDLKEPFNRVSVTNPNIADVFSITPTQLLVNGKSVGVTSLVVFYPQKTLFFDLVVQTDLGLLGERLKQIAPRDAIAVDAAQDAIILRGSVANEHIIAGAVEVAGAFAPRGKVVNLLTVAEVKPQQVMLQVHVAEVQRQALRELGFNLAHLGKYFAALTAFPGVPFPPFALQGGSLLRPGGSVTSLPPTVPFTPFQQPVPTTGLSGGLATFAKDEFSGLLRVLAERNALRTLAKPNLVTQSGKEAKFISGGEFPFPVAQQNNTITIEFKEFGVGLVFTPVVVDGETITIKVRPEVSSLDFSQGLVASGFSIPVLRKNQAFTNVSLKDGESFAIAGLINNEVRQQISKIPLLGDIPILGTLFRSTSFQNNESELLFLVTVKLVRPEPPGSPSIPDPGTLMELREAEKRDFTHVPGIPGVGEVVDRPFGKSNFSSPEGRR